jgi:hypothetical protein
MVETFSDLDTLPDTAAGLFRAPDADLFGSRAWYRTVLDHAMAPGATSCFALCRIEGSPAALFPLQTLPGGGLASLSNFYTCRWAPLLAADLDGRARREVAARFAAFCRRFATTRLDALDADDRTLESCTEAARAAGLRPLPFAHFGNWHEPVGGLGWQRYLAGRPGALRETVRRKLKRDADRSFEVVTGGDDLEPGIAAFEAVYRQSWKDPEPFPAFNAALMRQAAALGMLRLGVLRIAGAPAAAQLWVLERDRATVLKLAHDEALKSASPGTVLTALMLRRLLDEDGVAEIDFGRGDDPYKRAWASERRQRVGVVLANPYRARGLAALVRHALGRARARLRRG